MRLYVLFSLWQRPENRQTFIQILMINFGFPRFRTRDFGVCVAVYVCFESPRPQDMCCVWHKCVCVCVCAAALCAWLPNTNTINEFGKVVLNDDDDYTSPLTYTVYTTSIQRDAARLMFRVFAFCLGSGLVERVRHHEGVEQQPKALRKCKFIKCCMKSVCVCVCVRRRDECF